MATDRFIHLHVHTEYSLLDGLSKIEDLLTRAVELGMDSLAITDHGVMYGAIKFYLKAKDFGIKPIIGIEAYVATRSRFDKQAGVDNDRYHLILLSKNEKGYHNLLKLTTIAHLEGFYYKPRIDLEALKQYSSGLIATSACIEGEIPSLILQGREKDAEAKAKVLQEIFKDDFYLEIQHHPKIAKQGKANLGLIKLSRKLGIPLVATNDSHYVNADDAEAQDALLAVQTQRMVSDKNRLTMLDSPDFYLKSQEEMIEAFADIPEAIENTVKIADQCSLEIPLGRWILPDYPLPQEITSEKELRNLVFSRLKVRYGENPPPEIVSRLEYELGIICKKGFATYFLIVQDFVNWAKKEGIRVGPGRGSVAGSLVSYVLRITSIDPLKHNLPFERFMNPERPSPPDIDMDFADDRRQEVISYISKRYGEDKVAQIVTFNVMKAKEAVRDIGRVLGMPYSEPDKISKLIPVGMKIDEALKSVPELAVCYREPKYKKLLDLARKVEGTSRHASTHAAGVVIADKILTNYTALQKVTHGEGNMTQYDMYSLDLNVSEKAIGLLKMDVLGLRNLTILEKALRYVESLRGIKIDLSEIPLDDKGALKLIATGETTGIFQLESEGMKRLAKKLRPNKFSDVSAMVALYRPGPMQFIDEFVNGKKHPEAIKYPHPDLRSILEETYGIAVYQEQCLLIANVMGGYSLGEADNLRRAIGKKKKSIMDEEKKKFIKKAVEKGYSKTVAENVFALIERFASYGFNKAHSTSYAMIAYETAYLKSHYPVEFMTALLTAESAGASGPVKDKKMIMTIDECRKMEIVVKPPDINRSQVGFTVDVYGKSLGGQALRFGGQAILFGLSAIKHVGEAAIGTILEARSVGGDFRSLMDFCRRVDQQKVNKKVLESLIRSGAMDSFGKRSAMLAGLEQLRNKGAMLQKQKSNGQVGFFDDSDDGSDDSAGADYRDNLPALDEFTRNELLTFEKELLGFYLTENPLAEAMGLLAEHRTHQIAQLEQMREKGTVKIAGAITEIRIVVTKKTNQEMAFARIEDETGSIEAVIFPKIFARTKACWERDKVVLATGHAEERQDSPSFLVDEAIISDSIKEKNKEEKEGRRIKIPARTTARKLVMINQLLKENPGEDKVALVFLGNNRSEKLLPLPFGINFSPSLLKRIEEVLQQSSS